MNPQLIIAALIAAISSALTFQIQSWRMDAKEKDHVQQILANERLSSAQTLRQSEAAIAAQSAATLRATTLRRAADGSRTAIVSLSDATAAAMRDAAITHDACLVRANSLGELLGTMAAAGGEVSAKADRHANDIQTVKDAWPKQ